MCIWIFKNLEFELMHSSHMKKYLFENKSLQFIFPFLLHLHKKLLEYAFWRFKLWSIIQFVLFPNQKARYKKLFSAASHHSFQIHLNLYSRWLSIKLAFFETNLYDLCICLKKVNIQYWVIKKSFIALTLFNDF